MPVKQKSIKKNALINALRTLTTLLFPLITFPYVTRILQPEGIGKVNFAAGIISYYTMIAGLGVVNYGTREVAKRRNNTTELTKVSKELFILNIISTIIAYILFTIGLLLVPKFRQYTVLLFIYSITILFTTLGMEWLYNAMEDYSYITIRSILFQFLGLVLLFIFVKTKNDYIIYTGIIVFSNVGSNICNFVHSRVYIDWAKKVKLDIRQHLKPVFILFGMSLAVGIYTILDTTMLGFISDDTQVGYYTAATKITKLLLGLIASVSAVLLPRLSYYVSCGNKKDFNNTVIKSINFLLCVSLPASGGLILLSKQIIFLFSGPLYEPAVSVMCIMSPIIIMISLSGMIGIQVFMPIGKEKLTLISVITGCIINFSCNVFFIPHYGAFGAGIGTVVAETCVTIIQIYFARKIITYRLFLKPVTEYIGAAIGMGIVVYGITIVIHGVFLSLFIGIATGITVYSFLLFLMRNNFFITLIKELLQRGK
jgi:O-antigen/teichoic acid export membrane protein